MTLIANARMYSVAPGAAEAWTTLFHHIAKATGIPLHVIPHPFPLPVSDLWQRPDLACAFMCGWPWIRGVADVVPVAAPLPLDAPGPRYWTNLVVHRDHPAHTLADLAGQRIGYTLLDSQSGFSALRHHLRVMDHQPLRFAEIVGPITTPRRVLEAVADRRVDLAPVDSFAHALLRHHEPDLAAQSRVLAATEPTPIPLLVASRATDPAIVAALRAAFLAVTDPTLLSPLTLQGFTDPLPASDYMLMETNAQSAEQAGIHDLTPFLQTSLAA